MTDQTVVIFIRIIPSSLSQQSPSSACSSQCPTHILFVIGLSTLRRHRGHGFPRALVRCSVAIVNFQTNRPSKTVLETIQRLSVAFAFLSCCHSRHRGRLTLPDTLESKRGALRFIPFWRLWCFSPIRINSSKGSGCFMNIQCRNPWGNFLKWVHAVQGLHERDFLLHKVV